MFKIDVYNMHWLDELSNKEEDLCLHGHATTFIGTKKLEYDATVSATALYLLKSLTENHIINEDNQMLPCCGFSLIADDKSENVIIVGCNNGIDWSIIHEGENIKLILEDDSETIVSLQEYKNEVFQFADKVEAFYKASPPRKLPKCEFDRNGYITFWKEWHRRRTE
ncbi:hypothetical protein [Clostridium sp. MD294]|uniref:hypothetical protein n=1 Tax=Clostridium sp. MD294 TaxID=97138 RepID=UPI0002C9FF9C|nr:hypothetical protein [Clostridium sp. MD294]NDO46790.1 hypothetical protein [Clostridium sp. MD294]USF28768.1 hypothetical protein C820_000142 [Clostridium sp. MD294]